MRFSDLGKTPAQESPPPGAAEKARRQPLQADAPPQPVQTKLPADAPQRKESGRPDKTAAEMPSPLRQKEALAGYGRLLGAAKEYIDDIDQPYTEKYVKITGLCAASAQGLKDNPSLLGCAAFASAGNYLYAHTANVTLFSQAIALELSLAPEEMTLLSFCAMSHDLGMTGLRELYIKEGRLSDPEFAQVTLHAQAGAAKLDRVMDIPYAVKQRAKIIISQTHERSDASGYPGRRAETETDLLAQIIAIADVYEAMTHPRPWREALPPPDAMKQLIATEGRSFNSKIVKALISALSIYPPSSLVELSTGEIARVLIARKGSLTRPLAEILLDRDAAAAEPKLVDLFKSPFISIARPVSFAELEKKNPKLAARVEFARWWVDW